MGENVQPIYVNLASEADDPHVTVIPSLCMACHQMGSTRLLMTRIPHYKEVVLTSFECEHCGNKNTGFQSGQVQEKGVRYQLEVQRDADLSRQVVKSEAAAVIVPEVELEIPASGLKGEVTTVEGILQRTIEGLSQEQPTRRQEDVDTALKIDTFIESIRELLTPCHCFTLIVDDPSGNSFVENPHAPKEDPQLKKTMYKRTKEQDIALGLAREEEEEEEEEEKSELSSITEEITSEEVKDVPENLKDEVLVFSTLCDRCSRPADTNMKVTKIPHFKEVIIMAMHCESCGHRTSEVKSGGGVAEKGRRITLRVTDPSDMARDVLKSETCELSIPELDLVVGGGLIGGKFTTLEGLLTDIKEDLATNPFLAGDSSTGDRKEVLQKLIDNLDEVLQGNLEVTFIMDDPAGNNYLQNLYAPDPDPEMTVEEYVRSYQQNEDLGLNDMKTENYGEKDAALIRKEAADPL